MKLIAKAVILVLVICIATSAFAARAPKSAVFGSPHDFKTAYGGASYSLCNYCHIAHKFGSTPTGPSYLLWNHTLSSVASYGVYTSDSMRSTPADLGGQMTVSNLCLSCHDGTVAINSWYEAPSFTPGPGTAQIMPQDHTARDLTKQHPINFTYPDATTAAAIGLQPAADLNSIDGNGNVPLFSGKMQCATCHDAHAGPTVSHLFFRAFPSTPAQTTTGAFCVYCHL
jgi:Doubled CXXCH motif (Paired_CXXCH_1)